MDIDEKLLQFLCRHLVCLGATFIQIDADGVPTEQVDYFKCPGWILSIHDTWCFVTAGHNLRQFELRLDHKQLRPKKCSLYDYFGPDAVHHMRIPFVYQRDRTLYVDEGGLDFGLVALSTYYQDQLELNNIVPVTSENWVHQDQVDYGIYAMLGLPQELTDEEYVQGQSNEAFMLSIRPALIWFSEPVNPPDNLPQTRFPRFVGQLPDDLPLRSIKGMSGGPIFGFSKKGDRYWVVAIQSSWLPQRKLTFGCPVKVFAKLVEDLLGYEEDDH
jgi:hypothetical protein